MIRASKVREIALQILCSWESNEQAEDTSAMQIAHDASDDAKTRMSAIEAAHKTWDARQSLDEWVQRIAPQWPPHRQPLVDRNLIRLAMWELSSKQTPHKVVIDEAIELAKLYSTENSPGFINGVLDAARKEISGLSS